MVKKNIKYGDSNEINVASALLNLYLDNPTFDSLSYDHVTLWEVLKSSKAETFSTFIKYFYSENLLQNIDLTRLLTNNGFGTSITDVSINSTGGLNVSWTKGGSVELSYNSYQLIVSNSFGEIIYEQNSTDNNYEIEKNEFERLLDINGKLYIFIKSEMYDYENNEALIVDAYYSDSYVFEKEFEIYHTINLNIENLNLPINFSINNNSIIELNNELRENIYNYTIRSSNEFLVILYDNELNSLLDVESQFLQSENEVNLNVYMDDEVKYMQIVLDSDVNVNEITISILEINNYILLNENYNMNEVYKVNKDKYKTALLFNNTQGAGYYMLNIETQDNYIIEEIRINKFYESEFNDNTSEMVVFKTFSNSNTLITYLEYNQQYNICISINDNTYDNLMLTITSEFSEQNITFSETEIRSEKFYNISMNQDVNGDSVKLINILKPVRLKLIVENEILKENNAVFVIDKQILNEDTICIDLDNVIKITNEINNTYINLEVGKYYFGIFNCIDFGTWNIFMERIIDNDTDYDSFIIDPGNGWQNGTQIEILEKNLTEKSYNSNIIIEGFTRIIYIDSIKAPSPSRLDYVWYSSNENVASVTSFGTVLAKNVSNRQTVMIYAIYKNDPLIILVKSFIIDPYNGENIIIQKNMNVGINQLETINMQNELPYNFLQYYIWTSNDMNIAKVDQFGRICGINEGTCIVTGSYIYNSNVIVNIYITVS